jgi:endoglucanase
MLGLLGLGQGFAARAESRVDWPLWTAFSAHFIEPDGRVIDRTAGDRSTSEAQVYALFFALVANQRPGFDTLLSWTENNLAAGDLRSRLPAWLWGRGPEGRWGVLDDNPASDADLWLAYTLLQAARLWDHPPYASLAEAILAQVRAHEVVYVGAAKRPMLSPAPRGFGLEAGGHRFISAYLPEFQFRFLAQADPRGPWGAIWAHFLDLSPQAFPRGLAPDYFALDASGAVRPDPEHASRGGYDAVRVYLWAGMTPDPSLLRQLGPFARLVERLGAPPESVDAADASFEAGSEPLGFSAALLPFLSALQRPEAARVQRQRLERERVGELLGSPPQYYDQALALFGEGYDQGRYRFDRDGRLLTAWSQPGCCQ